MVFHVDFLTISLIFIAGAVDTLAAAFPACFAVFVGMGVLFVMFLGALRLVGLAVDCLVIFTVDCFTPFAAPATLVKSFVLHEDTLVLPPREIYCWVCGAGIEGIAGCGWW